MANPTKPIRWTDQEWFDVMTHFVRERDSTSNAKPLCLEHAQRKALTKDRWRKSSAFAGNALQIARDYEMRYRAGWAPEGRSFTPPPGATPRATAPHATAPHAKGANTRENSRDDVRAIEATFTAPGLVRWTGHEWALVSAATAHAVAQGDTRALVRVMFHAQLKVLPLDRCRKINPLGAVGVGKLQDCFDEGLRHAASLPPDVIAKIQGRTREYEMHLAKTMQGLAPPPAPPTAEETERAAAELAHALDNEPPAPAPAAAPDVPATFPPTPYPMPAPTPAPVPAHYSEPVSPLIAPARLPQDPLAARIALILAGAASDIARESRAHVLGELDARLEGIAGAIASTVAGAITAGLRGEVQAILAQELGGPVSSPVFAPPLATPSAPPAPSLPPAAGPQRETPPETPRALTPDDDEWQPPFEAKEARDEALAVAMPAHAKLKVDVVGDLGVMARAIRNQTPDGIDVRLIEWEKARSSAWTPRAVVIMSAHNRSHLIQERARKKGAQVLMASAGPNSVVGLLHSLVDGGTGAGETLQ